MRIGEVIAGRFRIRSLIGSGGMGRVYRAVDESTEESVALKVLSLDAKKYSRRFLREAKVMAELSHPNIVRYVDYGETDRGAPYIVMEWVRGEDLRQRMNRKKVELSEALDVIAGTGEALAFAHSRGVIHRDLKPSNLMLVGGDIQQIKLLDFGIARWRGPAVEKMTQTGISIGTPGYMAPEQSRGDSIIDGRADLYALGCVIYETLVGTRPFQGEDVSAMLARTALDEPPRVSETRADISPAFDDLLADMMAANVDRRPIDGHVMAERARNTVPSILTATVTGGLDLGLSEAERELLSVLLLEATPADSLEGVNAIAEQAGASVLRHTDGCVQLTCQDLNGSATDLAVRAVRCALDLRATFPKAKLAVATGLAELAALTSKSRLMMSASELRRTAEGPPLPRARALSIRVDETTYRLLDGRFDVRRRREDPSAGFDLFGDLQVEFTHRVPKGAPPCVGREKEVAEILEWVATSINQQEAKAMVILGEAGIGKSRLSGEVVQQVYARYHQTEIWSARGQSNAGRSTLSLAGRILRQACGIKASDGLALRREKIVAQVERYLGTQEMENVAPFLGELSDTPFPADSRRPQLLAARGNVLLMGQHMRQAWQRFNSAVCQRHPVLLLIEDLHEADTPSLQLIESMLSSRAGCWLVLGLARPEFRTSSPRLWSGQGAVYLQLNGLSEMACKEMINSLLGHAAIQKTVQRITRLSKGNALFIEELLRSTKQKKRAAISSTVLALTMAKLQSLQPATRRVLRAASLFGASFTLSGLGQLLGEVPNEELALLSELEIFVHDSAKAVTGAPNYRFADQLVRDAAYSTLTQPDLEHGHLATGCWLYESGVTDGAILAQHFELGKDKLRAAQWYQHGAQSALTRDDLAEAMKCAQRGIDTGISGDVFGQLHSVMAEALLWSGDYGAASEHSQLALDAITAPSDAWSAAAGIALTSLGRCGARTDIQNIANRLLVGKPTQGYSGAAVSALAQAASQLYLLEHYSLASEILQELPPEANMLADSAPWAHGHLLNALACRSAYGGDLSSHLRLSHASVAQFQSCGDRRNAALVQINVGFAYAQLGDFTSAERILRETLDLATMLDLGSVDSIARKHLGQVLLSTGQHSEAWDLELVAIESFQMQGDERMANGSRVYLSRVHQLQGSLDSAESQAREALHGTNTAKAVRMQAYAQLASVLLDLGRPKEALQAALDARGLLRELGQVSEGESFVRLTLVKAHEGCHQELEAQAALSEAHSSLLERFNHIEDPSLRLSFIEQVQTNAQIVSLATTWGINGEG